MRTSPNETICLIRVTPFRNFVKRRLWQSEIRAAPIADSQTAARSMGFSACLPVSLFICVKAQRTKLARDCVW